MIGTFAYIDWPPYGLIPCKVIDVHNGPKFPWLHVKITKTMGPCRRGEEMTLGPSSVVPRKRRSRR